MDYTHKDIGWSTTIKSKRIPMKSVPPYSTTNPNLDIGGTYYDSLVPGSESCVGFGKYITRYLYGTLDYGTAQSKTSTNTAALARSVIQSYGVGARFTGYRANGTRHTMIVASYDASGVTVYHANWQPPGHYNIVRVTYMPYAEYCEEFIQTEGYKV